MKNQQPPSSPEQVSPNVGDEGFQSPEDQSSGSGSMFPPEADSRRAVRSIFVASGLLLIGICVAVVAQYLAPDFDHQNANLIGIGAVGLTAVYLLFSIYRVDWRAGHRFRLPGLLVALLIGFVVLFRFDGFSGEMLPIFKSRFAAGESFVLESVKQSDERSESGTGTSASQERQPAFDSPQFLGPARNGVISERLFQVPMDPAEVEVVWDHGIGQGWSSFSVSGGFAVTLEQRDDQECLSCYRIADGGLEWMTQHEGLHHNTLGGTGPRSTPTIDQGKVYATTATGHLWCVTLEEGNVVWSHDLLSIAGWNQVEFEAAAPWGYAPSPLIVDNLCIVPLGGPRESSDAFSLIAFDRENGDIRWKGGDDQLSYASPMLMTFDGDRHVVSVNEKTVSGHRLTDGKTLWSFDWPGSTNTGATCASALPVPGGRVLVGKGYGGGSALVQVHRSDNGWSTEDVWRSNRVLKTKFTHANVRDQVAFGISNGSLQAVDLTEPSVFWTQPRRQRSEEGHSILVDDVLVVQDEQGDLVFVNASLADYEELLRLDALNSKTWNIPTVAGRYVLVRNDRQAICYRMPPIESDAIDANLPEKK
ncbi:outer membrane protein assembly factor BamB family protein [Roseiconus lacunae]|uniref:outer membrane protein assembly factor BamB family protein n=1 Tax=Roseiconus lacunae TaxID=2605694 RepID=UPI001E440EE7|nr:PQQ-binding-like beta-propeller repeat protein [Roseiconus lacunae]MCD0460105.1 PQQ-binding-like beta-propeller repeat protein [Roseiconus lacunae]